MTATYTFTAFGATHADIVSYAKRRADAYWQRTPYKTVSITANSHGADVVTQEVAVAG